MLATFVPLGLLVVAQTSTPATPAGTIAFLFDDGRKANVLYGFERRDGTWGKATSSVQRWTRCLDGKARGELLTKSPPAADADRVAELQLKPGQPTPFPGSRTKASGKRFNRTSYDSDDQSHGFFFHPLVLSAEGRCGDPEGWKPGKAPPDAVRAARAAFELQATRSTPGDRGCGVALPPHSAEDLVPSSAYRSNRDEWLVTLSAEGLLSKLSVDEACDLHPQVYRVSADRTAVFLGYDMVLIDAGDYDGDGHSELAFYVADWPALQDDTLDGFAVFWGDRADHVDALWRGESSPPDAPRAAHQALISDAGLAWPRKGGALAREASCTKPLTEAARTFGSLLVGDGKMDTAERTYGPSPLHESGDASSYLGWRCWSAANGDGTILYLARGEMDETLRLIGPEMDFPERAVCPKSALVDHKLASNDGLRLGLSRAEVQRRVGQPTRTRVGWYEQQCFGKLQETGDTWFSSSVTVVEQAGRSVGIEVSYVEAD